MGNASARGSTKISEPSATSSTRPKTANSRNFKTSDVWKNRRAESQGALDFVKEIGSLYERTLEENSTQTLAEFRTQFDEKDSQSELGFDVQQSKYFDLIQMTRSEFNALQEQKRKEAGLEDDSSHFYFDYGRPKHHPLKTRRTFEFKLNEKELSILSEFGTVISSKQLNDFGTAYSTLYSNDIPVYFSADSVLHAWHHSFDLMLEELETSVLSICLQKALNELLGVAQTKLAASSSPVLADVAHFLAVPLALLTGKEPDFVQDRALRSRVQQTLQLVMNEATAQAVLFGPEAREVDFSQFKPRGHYTKSEDLQKYFRGMMWLGRTEFELTKKKPDDIRAAFCLREILAQSPTAPTMLLQIATLLTNFIGITDSLTFEDLEKFLAQANEANFSSENYDHDRDGPRLFELMQELDLGGQLINSQIRDDSDVEDGIPRAATLLGQKFTLDAWAMTKLVYPADDLRRIPSGVDVAYSVLGNDAAGRILAQRMAAENETPVQFRDGRDVSAQLASVRRLVEQTPDEFWDASIYGMWVKTLRSLSQGTASNTKAWNAKTMQSQLASWAQLRHDTILYVKQGYTVVCCCEYPDALVEPNPEFWMNLEQMAQRTCTLIEGGYPAVEIPNERDPNDYFSPRKPEHTKELEEKHVRFLQSFAGTIGTLRGMAEKQARKETLSKDDMDFMNRICTMVTIGSGGERDWNGWYPELFYGANMNVTKEPALVADVHSDPPSFPPGDPGCIVHVGVGEIRLCYTARLNHAGEPTLYVGPMMMFYEHLTPWDVRWDDDEWKKQLAAGALSVPEWIKPYVA